MTYLALDPFIESRVDAYEAMLVEAPQTDLSEFLPQPDHEKYLPVLLELLRVDLDQAWSRGERRLVADYQESFPAIFRDADALQQIVFEEFRLRCEAGERPDTQLYERQYRISTESWPALSDCDTEPVVGDVTRIDQERGWAGIPTPKVGTDWHGFQIVEVLGSGTFGKTFRATQTALANREVVLKFSRLNQREAWRLARLRHTNIVPVLSVHEYGDHCAICMPYLGRRTLADLLATDRPPASVVRDRVSSALQLTLALADALQHSHCRGILHGDVKPANILVSDDQQPLLFDFNLAVDTQLAGANKVRGGTLAYMAPEQLQSWVGDDVAVDHRADIYSLGVVLYQLLTHRLPWPMESKSDVRALLTDRLRPAALASANNPAVSPAVSAIVAKCLECHPDNRYQSAAELHDDLRRHLDDLPLVVARNNSFKELCSKWMRRHPRLTSATTVGLLASFVCCALAAGWLIREARHRPIAAAHTLHEFTATWNALRTDFAVASFTPGWADDVTADAEQIISQFALDDPTQIRRTLLRLDRRQRTEWLQNASGLCYMLSNARYYSALRQSDPRLRLEQLQSSLAYNQLARDFVASEPASRALQHRRQQIVDALTSVAGAESASVLSDSGSAPRPSLLNLAESATGWAIDNFANHDRDNWYDQLFLGLEARDDHDLEGAEQHFRQAIRMKPDDATGWLLLGDVLRGLQQYEPAAAAFDVASSLTRDSTAAIFQRGLCWLALRQLDRAIADFTVVIQRRPELDSARLNRALAYMARQQHELALADLDAALADGCRESRAYFLRSRVRQQLGDTRAAQTDLQAGLRQPPRDAVSWIARGVARMKQDPQAALADFESALRLDAAAAEAWHNQAHVYSEILGQPQRAIEALNACLRQNASDTIALAGRGVLLARMGKTKDAREDAERLLDLPLDAITRYQVACIYALCAPDDAALETRALSLLAESLRQDPKLADMLDVDPDLNGVRDRSEFREIVSAISVLRERESAGPLTRQQGASK